MENYFLPENQLEHKLPKKKIYIYTGSIFAVCVIFYFLFLSAPGAFSAGSVVKIEPGMGLRSVSLILQKENIIRSRVAFESFAIIFGGDKYIKSADYFFEKKLPVYVIAWRISRGEHNMAPVSVTIPEGFNNAEIADAFAIKLMNFDKNKFTLIAKEKEGYLFPDTYFFLNNDNENTVLRAMSENFNKKIISILPEIASSGKSEKDIIIMASIIEREARGDQDRGFISGILWKRISLNIPLQVDAAMETYKVKGLPKNPIANPGLEAIKAAIYPQKSPYLYYLHDKDGNIHYAKTFAEHTRNIAKYLK